MHDGVARTAAGCQPRPPVDSGAAAGHYPPRGDMVGTTWNRYRALFASSEFLVTAACGLLSLASAVLGLAGAGFWVHAGFALAAAAVGGLPIAAGAVRGLLRRQVNVDELVTIAIAASVAAGEYLSAAFVAFMMLFGKLLEDFTAERARTALENLGTLVPAVAAVRRDGRDVEVPAGSLVPGDLLMVRPGERIAADGVVAAGHASVNQAPITGESMPVAKSPGSEVYAGTLNELGALEVRVTGVGEATALGQVRRLIEEAEAGQAPVVRTADRYARFFTPAILVVAAAVLLATRSLTNALSVLIVACPCALVLATPIAVVAGVANGARRGILIKGGARLEAAGTVTAVALDKTGTITLGEPRVERVMPLDGRSDREVLSMAAAAERLSEHPLGRAVTAKAAEWGLDIGDAGELTVIPGRGVIARTAGSVTMVGTAGLLSENGVPVRETASAALESLERDGLTPILVADADSVAGVIGVADAVRPEMLQAVEALRKTGVRKVVMLTGDGEAAARRVAGAVGIDEWQSRLLPAQKVQSIRDLQAEGYKVAMLGDGINDAPALVQADVGVAMGVSGTDLAMDAADIVLMTDDALKAVEAISLSRLTLRTIRQNLVFALAFNVLGIVLASTGVLPPIGAALFHNFGSVAVVVNSARLVGRRPR
jgi:Zn2+/Cd2+-exporting ATPase